MKRKFLVAAVAVAPLMIGTAPAFGQVTISSATSTPVKTSTANAGAPSDVTIAAGGSIGLTAAGTALTLDSNNTVDNAGAIGATGFNDTTGIDVIGGFTGTATTSGSITITENYTAPTDPNNNGLYTGAFAQGTDRIGLLVSQPTSGSDVFVGSIIDTGQITVNGQDSEGISIQAPISGDLLEQVVTPATSSVAATVADGTITVTGENTVGLQVTPTGGVGGNVRITGVAATGTGSEAVQLDGNVGGSVNISGVVDSTGYRTTTRQTDPYLSVLYSQEEMQQNGAAVTVGASVGSGLIVSAPPPILSTTNLDQDSDGVPDSLQGTGQVISYGSAPAIQIGATSASGTPVAITLGAYTASNYISPYNSTPPGQTFGLVIQGVVSGQSLFDQLTSPYLLQPVSATALQIGGQILISPDVYTYNSKYQPTSNTPSAPAVYLPSGQVSLSGGLYNSGSITAYAYQADATGIHVGAGATVPTIYNDGQIFASSIQVNSATTVTVNGGGYPNTPAPVPVNVTAIQIDPGASVSTITNNSGILAELTGTGGVGGTTTAILDQSGTLQNVNNTGSITAELNQTLSTALMPTQSSTGASNTVAIDMSAGTLAQTITQTFSPLATSATTLVYNATDSYALHQIVSYQGNIYVNVVAAGAGYDPIDDPSYWREIGAVSPSITGDIYFGSGQDTLNVQAGSVTSGTISFGGALNTITVNGTATSPASVSGNITEQSGGTFQINVNNGSLSDTNPTAVSAIGVNIGANGALLIAADPLHGTNTEFLTTGTSTLQSGAEIGLTLNNLQAGQTETYTVIKGAAGSITAGTLGVASGGIVPFFYTAAASYVPVDSSGDSEVDLTVTRKSATQLGFNAAEAAAYNAIVTALPANAALTGDPGIQQALLAQTTEAGLKSVYDQLLPNQGQGIFQALDAAAERISAFTDTPPDNATHAGGSSLWVQEVNERVHNAGLETVGSDAQVLGVVGGYERMGVGGGALGVTLGYINAEENTAVSQIASRDVANFVEASLYYRRSIGNFTFGARGGGGYGWFSENRVFAYENVYEQAKANWTGDFIDGHVGAAYEVKLFGPYYARPAVSIDYLRLHQNSYQEGGADPGFNLAVAPHDDTQFTGQAIMTLGRQWGRAAWLRTEMRFGYREVFAGDVGGVTANFANGEPFTILGDPDKGGWMTVGFSLKSGSQYSYLALEGDADFRSGEQRYDLRVAGRSVF